MNDIQKGFQLSEPNPALPFTAPGMSAFKVSGVMVSAASDTDSAWKLQDNLGTMHTYFLYASADMLQV